MNDKFLAMGTEWGVVYIFDFNGNEIRRFNAHPNHPIREIRFESHLKKTTNHLTFEFISLKISLKLFFSNSFSLPFFF